ncbi:MAG: HvfC/BufC N-terminal domain-containing protein [Brevundimonas sp.]|uniref:HvfC/BufC N-terminal domain-containing protein n=1 Tax=Brevundimonas sp. TaxID=1871086 RepID=UPI004034C4AB
MSLKALQADFQAYVRDEEERAGAFAAQLATPAGGDGARRMRVYHHAYRARLGQVLREVFDKTWSYLGDEAFDRAVETYVACHPSTSASLDDFGAAFPEHVASLWPAEADVGELAWLDWAMRRVFDGEDAEVLDAGVLGRLSGEAWNTVGFAFHPTLTVRAVTTNVGALWAGLEEDSPLVPAPLEAPMAVRVWRKDWRPHFRTIDAVEATALAEMVQGRTFAEVCERLTHERMEEPVERAAALLAVWLQDGLIVGLTNI